MWKKHCDFAMLLWSVIFGGCDEKRGEYQLKRPPCAENGAAVFLLAG